nr:protein Rae1 [Drosophila bipectinata]
MNNIYKGFNPFSDGGGFRLSTRSKKFGDEVKDYELGGAPTDSVSALEFSGPSCSFLGLSAASWDGTVRFWRIDQEKCEAVPKAMTKLNSPPLDTSWSDDGTGIHVGDCEGNVVTWDLMTDKVLQLGRHSKGVRSCHSVTGSGSSYLMTTSWDKTVKFWDPRMSAMVASLQLPERSYAADVRHPLAVVACADSSVIAISLENGPVEKGRFKVPRCGTLSNQVRSLAIYNAGQDEGGMGWALSRIDGRVSFQNLLNSQNRDFMMKCHVDVDHNEKNDVFAVNDLSFQPGTHVLATAGSNGQYKFWDYNNRRLIKQRSVSDMSLTKCTFNGKGDMFAYAVGYDWCMGHDYFDPNFTPQIFLKSVEHVRHRKYRRTESDGELSVRIS